MREAITTDQAAPAVGAYSQAILTEQLVFTSGQIPRTATGDPVSGDIAVQARQSLTNVKAILEAAGSGMDRIVKCTVFLADIADAPAVNAAYAEFFDEPYPARSMFQAAALPAGARIEIEAIARR